MADPISLTHAPQSATPAPRPALAGWLAQTNEVTRLFLGASQIPGLINLAGGLPDASVWPVEELAEIAGRVVREDPALTLAYSPIEGLAVLRDAIAARFSTGGLLLTRDNILITTGGMHALELIGKVLVDPGQTIAAQSPAYLGALDAWRPRMPRYRPLHLARDPDLVAGMAGAQFAYTVPNFSNPTGRLVPLEQRRALVEAAHATGTWLVEDDPYGTLYYDGTRLPRLIELAAGEGAYDGPVIYLGTVSKELAPGLRLGWVIAAPEMVQALVLAKQGSDMSTSGLCQMILLRALQAGLLERVLPGILSLYSSRRDALLAAMDEHLSDLFTWTPPEGGMFVWARARDPRMDTDRLLRLALDHGTCVSPSSVFDPEGLDHGAIRVNFTLNPPEKLAEGVRRLAEAARATLAEGIAA
ncbi:aminotransferase class I/II-fold pyridoxal phosphate-dependent enzyme [Paracoccus limosus]|uniref:Aminotransferase class I/II-fold pyridoxal phosphate-dependent enzyme n=1 Tax=Paracoccus limosus TaxID=913252 RepID=A0A844H412_9RHOB|nr:PLP-dependent aminotransferase family protein [Paracoccus limosus]MTH35552.1 aminotransferase class I/II-fold pyridoxal phosphate-dependent enzyme [Paracoccus limosus]